HRAPRVRSRPDAHGQPRPGAPRGAREHALPGPGLRVCPRPRGAADRGRLHAESLEHLSRDARPPARDHPPRPADHRARGPARARRAARPGLRVTGAAERAPASDDLRVDAGRDAPSSPRPVQSGPRAGFLDTASRGILTWSQAEPHAPPLLARPRVWLVRVSRRMDLGRPRPAGVHGARRGQRFADHQRPTAPGPGEARWGPDRDRPRPPQPPRPRAAGTARPGSGGSWIPPRHVDGVVHRRLGDPRLAGARSRPLEITGPPRSVTAPTMRKVLAP